mgnify:CR=1 FL=1
MNSKNKHISARINALLRLPEPKTIPIRETLDEGATFAELYNAGYNADLIEIESWDQIPEGFEPLNGDDKAEYDRVLEEVYWLRQESDHLEGQKEIS